MASLRDQAEARRALRDRHVDRARNRRDLRRIAARQKRHGTQVKEVGRVSRDAASRAAASCNSRCWRLHARARGSLSSSPRRGRRWPLGYVPVTPARRKKIEERKAARRCIQCNAGLQATDVVLCVECVEAREEARKKYEKKNPGRKRKGKGTRWYDKPEARRAEYFARKSSGEKCVVRGCTRPPARDSVRCKPHRDQSAKASREHQRRRTWPRILARNIWRVLRAITRPSRRDREVIALWRSGLSTPPDGSAPSSDS